MDILLDTCAILWAILDPARLSTRAKEALVHEDSSVYVSPISAAEIACGIERGRIKLTEHWKIWLRRYIERNGWFCPPIDLDIVEEAYSLPPPFHGDPADRIIVATARLNRFHIATGDSRILAYPHVRTIW
jgi:PIN domain nuclease of toxin-antitoxin system